MALLLLLPPPGRAYNVVRPPCRGCWRELRGTNTCYKKSPCVEDQQAVIPADIPVPGDASSPLGIGYR